MELHSCSIAPIVSRPSSFHPMVQLVSPVILTVRIHVRLPGLCREKPGLVFQSFDNPTVRLQWQRLLRDSQHCSQSDGVQSRPEQQTPWMKYIRGEMIELLYFLSSLFLQDVLNFCRYVYMSRPRWSSLDLNMSIKHEHRKQN